MDRPGRAGPEPGDLLADGVHIALGQELTDAPHVPVQGEELVADVVCDLSELRPRRQPLRSRSDAPQRMHARVERVAERDAVPEAPGHGDRVVAEGEGPGQGAGRRNLGRVDDHETQPGRDHGVEVRVLAGWQRGPCFLQELHLLLVRPHDPEVTERPGAERGGGQAVRVAHRPGEGGGP